MCAIGPESLHICDRPATIEDLSAGKQLAWDSLCWTERWWCGCCHIETAIGMVCSGVLRHGICKAASFHADPDQLTRGWPRLRLGSFLASSGTRRWPFSQNQEKNPQLFNSHEKVQNVRRTDVVDGRSIFRFYDWPIRLQRYSVREDTYQKRSFEIRFSVYQSHIVQAGFRSDKKRPASLVRLWDCVTVHAIAVWPELVWNLDQPRTVGEPKLRTGFYPWWVHDSKVTDRARDQWVLLQQ